MSAITMIATATAKPGQGDELEKVIQASVAPTHAEPGNLHYSLHRSVQDPHVFVLVERWESMQALQAHAETDHVKTILAESADLMTGPPHAQVLTQISEGDPAKGRI